MKERCLHLFSVPQYQQQTTELILPLTSDYTGKWGPSPLLASKIELTFLAGAWVNHPKIMSLGELPLPSSSIWWCGLRDDVVAFLFASCCKWKRQFCSHESRRPNLQLTSYRICTSAWHHSRVSPGSVDVGEPTLRA